LGQVQLLGELADAALAVGERLAHLQPQRICQGHEQGPDLVVLQGWGGINTHSSYIFLIPFLPVEPRCRD
jgi:hypothetical protein